MKKTLCTYLFAHLALMALGGALGAAILFSDAWLTSVSYSPLWLLLIPLYALAAFAVGELLRRRGFPFAREQLWNAAITLYIISLALLTALWKLHSPAVRILNSWNFSALPSLLGFDAYVGNINTGGSFDLTFRLLGRTARYRDLILPLGALFITALEPLCLTLALSRRSENNIPETTKEEQ